MPSLHQEITLKQKLKLILLGLFIFFVLLEISLRLGEFVISSLQEHRNTISLKQKGTYRIMCLGESTTAHGGSDSYPCQLEEILNKSSAGIRFSVINKGVRATNTSIMASGLEDNIKKYSPDMVITMIGINDGGTHMPYEPPDDSRIKDILRTFKTYKLFRLLELHIVTKLKESGLYKYQDKTCRQISSYISFLYRLKECFAEQSSLSTPEEFYKESIKLNPSDEWAYIQLGRLYARMKKYPEAKGYFKEALGLNPVNEVTYIELGNACRSNGELSVAESGYKKVLEINPNSDQAYLELGRLYRDQLKSSEAIEMYKKVIELNLRNDYPYVELARFYRYLAQYSVSEALLKKALLVNPRNDGAYRELAWFYSEREDFAGAERMYRKAIELNPKSSYAYIELGRLYRELKKYPQAEECFKKAIEIDPEEDRAGAYHELGRLYRELKKYPQAEECFKKVIELFPDDDRAYAGLALTYEEEGSGRRLAGKYYNKAQYFRTQYYNPITYRNYREIKRILDKYRIKLICVQYPMRNITPLKEIFKGQEGVVFVDNERLFKDAVKKTGYNDYFVDMFAGDFGHCTRKGNRLLAEHIASVIPDEVVKKK